MVRPAPKRSVGDTTTKRREKKRTKPDPKTTAFGIDIGKKVFHVVVLNAAGAVIQRAKSRATP